MEHRLDIAGEALLVDGDRGGVGVAGRTDHEGIQLHHPVGAGGGRRPERLQHEVAALGGARGEAHDGGPRCESREEDPQGVLTRRQGREAELAEGVGERLAARAGHGHARVLERGAADAVHDAAGDRAGGGRLGREQPGKEEGRGDQQEAREGTGG